MRRPLTVNQRYVLQQIRELNGSGYLSIIRQRVKDVSGKDITLGRMADILDRAERRNWISAQVTHIEAEWKQGGRTQSGKRRVKAYEILPSGLAVLLGG